MKTPARWLLAAAAASVPAGLWAQAPPLGSEFRANTYTTGVQYLASLASRGNGSFVVVWTSEDQDGSSTGVFGQRFDSSGSKAGAEFPINTDTSGAQAGADVAIDGSGNFVVVWQSDGQDGSDLGVFGQRFDGSGAKLGGEFQVNTSTSLNQADPSIAMDKAGNFVVVWSSNRNDFAHDDIFGQRFDSSGAKLGSEFPVNTSTALPSLEPSIAMDGAGNFVVIWSLGLFSSDVFGQRFDVSGAKIGAEFEVNTYTTDIQFRPSVAMAKNGKFVVVWAGSDGSHEQIFGQRFGPSGAKVGAEFRVNTFTAASHFEPSIAMDSTGNFVVAWTGNDQDGSESGVFGQRFEGSGARIGGEFQVNAFTTGFQTHPRVIDDGVGLTVVWSEAGSDDSSGIFGRRQNLQPFALAVDSHGGSSDQNGVLEPGEIALVETSWSNVGAGSFANLTGLASFSGPSGTFYFIYDASASYGLVPSGSFAECNDGSELACYLVATELPRPTQHWDAGLQESLSAGGAQFWKLHLGDSFTDVPRAQPFYRKIETLLHNGITSGCSAAKYCPGNPVPRDQMAIFIAKALAGSGESVPTTGTVFFPGLPFGSTYNCSPGGTSLFFDIDPTDIFCKHVHYLAAQNVTLGCGGFKFCPGSTVTRDAMASFIAKAVVAPQGGAGVPETFSESGRSYSCSAASPNIHFTDVPASHPFCKHIHFLWAKGIVSGCSATQYCPGQPVNRDAMAKFIANGFGLQLYGP